MSRPISEVFDRRYTKENPYRNTRVKTNPNKDSPQYPKRMYRPKKVEKDTNMPSEEELDLLLAPPEMRKVLEEKIKSRPKDEDPKREHFKGIELVNRHRYGDDIDILRSTFTRTPEELEQEKFLLILAARRLCSTVFNSLGHIPRHEKYVMGGDLRQSCITVLTNSVAIKKRYYRKNLLEYIDIELEKMRELYRIAREQYPEWITEVKMITVFNAINEVGALVGGLLKTSVV